MTLLINGGNSHVNKICAILPNITNRNVYLFTTARDTWELKHPTLFNDVQSVSHKEIAVKNDK